MNVPLAKPDFMAMYDEVRTHYDKKMDIPQRSTTVVGQLLEMVGLRGIALQFEKSFSQGV